EEAASRERYRCYTIRMQMKSVDRLAPHFLAHRQHDRRDAPLHHHGCAPADAARIGVPARFHPWREVMQREHAGPLGKIGDRKVGSVNDVGLEAGQLTIQSPQPPAPFGSAAWAAATLEIAWSPGWHFKRLVGDEHELVIGVCGG